MLSDKKIKASIRNLNVFYRAKQVLKDVNLDIYSKSVTSLIGSSGCGKSTLLRCFNRMNDFVDDCKVTGEIIIDNHNICAPEVDVVLLRTRVGMVFQKPNPFPKSIYDNVAYGPRLQEMTNKRGQLDEIVQKSLVRSGLWDEVHDNLHQNAMELSGGQQQRLCIARAIAVKPTILLMDEPCSALDPKATKSIESLIIELKKKFTIIIVTHSMKQARSISDMVVYIEKGRVIEYGETEEVFHKLKGNSIGNYFTTND
ncbi:phosphate ABC transporter, ATP-binding protein [Neorickettsia helminthoeca str. Oregon]|uniref:Phosphate ABC transporter, ATP-binding protein n=1 Tax=Neorickettsia helminthoeca str. Oregon TaxID=1286528 RepID=X5H4R2_9RICK|nr:phosphate ABC transporter ATP-binding protein PstB [Neorickettsia helminthoeca]AHX11698.1 phosphate ABC transporter, ATP-binding protein [Neorickettsia helminthoeca str. Oregon]